MYVIRIDDGFTEWSYEMVGSDEYSIQDLIDIIHTNTDLVEKSAQQVIEPD